jgi:hypothetical protein
MSRSPRSLPAVLATAALLSALAAAPVLAHPPWISVELPASPWSSATRGAFLLVHAYRGPNPAPLAVTATAEGLVGGERRTIRVDLVPTGTADVYIVRRQWPATGVWVLRIAARQGDSEADALVGVGASGEVVSVRVPMRDGLPRPASDAEVGELLRTLAV